MPPIKTRASRARHFTPPIELSCSDGQVKTPQRSAVLAAKVLSQELNIQIPQETVRKLFAVPPRIQSRILGSKQVRTLHNEPDSGPDPRGRKKALLRSDTAAIANYLDDPAVPLDDKGKPWLNILEDAGVEVPMTTHFKPPGTRVVSTFTVQHSCKEDEGLINAVCDEEKELTEAQAEGRRIFSHEQLKKRPKSENWKDVAFCDEFHFGIGPQVTKRLKRRSGKEHRYAPYNVHRKKDTSKDTKAKAREEEHLELLNVFCVIGYNWKKFIPYEVPNSVGKMTTEVYTTVILPTIRDELLCQGLTLCQDADSAHTSKTTIKWAKDNGIELITLPGVSPDLSILETMAHPIKKKFHIKRCTTQKASLQRFQRVFEEEIDQGTIQNLYNFYAKRLHDCKKAKGQMTRY